MIAAPDGRAYRAAFAIAFISGGAVVALGVSDAVTPEPKPVIRTIVLDVPPACADAIDAARDERAHTETEQQHTGLAESLASERFDAELTLDDDTIAKAAKALDSERRLVQQAQLDRAAAANAFDAAAGDCLPEVNR